MYRMSDQMDAKYKHDMVIVIDAEFNKEDFSNDELVGREQ